MNKAPLFIRLTADRSPIFLNAELIEAIIDRSPGATRVQLHTAPDSYYLVDETPAQIFDQLRSPFSQLPTAKITVEEASDRLQELKAQVCGEVSHG